MDRDDIPSDWCLKKMLEHAQRTAESVIEEYDLPADKARMLKQHEEYLMGDLLADNAETMREMF